jgi:hypothetical protein
MRGNITPALVSCGILCAAVLASPGFLRAQAPPGPISPVQSKEQPPSPSTVKPRTESQNLPQKPNVAGSWKLNRNESDDAHKKMQEARGSNGGSSGGSGPYGGGRHGGIGGGYPGGRGPHGGYGGSQRGSSDEDRQKMQELFTPAESLIIAQQKDKDVEVRVTDDQNRQRVFYTDGRKVQKSKDDKYQEISAQWHENRLVSEEKSPRGGKMERSFEVAPGGEKLYVTLNVGGDRSSSSVYIHYVYDIVHENKQ